MAGCVPAASVRLALTEATLLAPARDRSSDGICPGPHHPPTGDHPKGNAFDVDHDPAHGWDNFVRAEDLRLARDPRRLKYVIFFGRMFASYGTEHRAAWEWGDYTGPNAHKSHMHVSIWPHARDDLAPWWKGGIRMLVQREGDRDVWEIVGSALYYVSAASFEARGRPRPVVLPASHVAWTLPHVR